MNFDWKVVILVLVAGASLLLPLAGIWFRRYRCPRPDDHVRKLRTRKTQGRTTVL